MKLEFESVLKAGPDKVWEWATSGTGINKELFPILRMTSLGSFKTEDLHKFELGVPLGKSWLLLFGFLPIDYSYLTLIEIRPGEGFLEQSPMLSMKLWRHERIIKNHHEGCIIRDVLTYEPRLFPSICSTFVKILFRNRHKKLKNEFG